MKFLIKSIGSTILGALGGWLGSFIGIGTGLFLGIVMSVVGWYAAQFFWNEYMD